MILIDPYFEQTNQYNNCDAKFKLKSSKRLENYQVSGILCSYALCLYFNKIFFHEIQSHFLLFLIFVIFNCLSLLASFLYSIFVCYAINDFDWQWNYFILLYKGLFGHHLSEFYNFLISELLIWLRCEGDIHPPKSRNSLFQNFRFS